MINFTFDKTDKGREEIATRKYGLASRLRTLLVLADGKKSTDELLKKVSGLGLNIQNFIELIDGEFIENVATSTGENEAALQSVNAASRSGAGLASPAAPEAGATSTPVMNIPEKNKLIGSDQVLALQSFFNETIKSAIGFRGFTLQLKVERAATFEEFKSLRQPYLEAVLKAKGNEMATSLRDRLDMLLLEAEKSLK